MIYFLQHIETGNVKIGTAFDYYSRFQQLEKKYGTLELIGSCDGYSHEETDLHQKFAHIRSEQLEGREWFFPTQELMDYIDNLPPHAPVEYKTVKVPPEVREAMEMLKYRYNTSDMGYALFRFCEEKAPNLLEEAKQALELKAQLGEVYKS